MGLDLISRPTARPSRRRGFTLVEVMIVITVLGILASVASPSFGRFVRDQRVKNATFDVYASIFFARSESTKRGADVAVNPTSAASWALGWRVVDSGGATIELLVPKI